MSKALLSKLDVLKGYKTKIAGLGLVCLAISAYLDGQTEEAIQRLFEGLGLFGIAFKFERSKS